MHCGTMADHHTANEYTSCTGVLYVTVPEPADVLFGRGSGPNDHPGNIRFRQLVAQRKAEYLTTNHRLTKARIATDIVDTIRAESGRFLKKVESKEDARDLGIPDDVGEVWLVVDENAVMEKAKQALRQNQGKAVANEVASTSPKPTAAAPNEEYSYQPQAFPSTPENEAYPYGIVGSAETSDMHQQQMMMMPPPPARTGVELHSQPYTMSFDEQQQQHQNHLYALQQQQYAARQSLGTRGSAMSHSGRGNARESMTLNDLMNAHRHRHDPNVDDILDSFGRLRTSVAQPSVSIGSANMLSISLLADDSHLFDSSVSSVPAQLHEDNTGAQVAFPSFSPTGYAPVVASIAEQGESESEIAYDNIPSGRPASGDSRHVNAASGPEPARNGTRGPHGIKGVSTPSSKSTLSTDYDSQRRMMTSTETMGTIDDLPTTYGYSGSVADMSIGSNFSFRANNDGTFSSSNKLPEESSPNRRTAKPKYQSALESSSSSALSYRTNSSSISMSDASGAGLVSNAAAAIGKPPSPSRINPSRIASDAAAFGNLNSTINATMSQVLREEAEAAALARAAAEAHHQHRQRFPRGHTQLQQAPRVQHAVVDETDDYDEGESADVLPEPLNSSLTPRDYSGSRIPSMGQSSVEMLKFFAGSEDDQEA
jgi:hypothetical protein